MNAYSQYEFVIIFVLFKYNSFAKQRENKPFQNATENTMRLTSYDAQER